MQIHPLKQTSLRTLPAILIKSLLRNIACLLRARNVQHSPLSPFWHNADAKWQIRCDKIEIQTLYSIEGSKPRSQLVMAGSFKWCQYLQGGSMNLYYYLNQLTPRRFYEPRSGC